MRDCASAVQYICSPPKNGETPALCAVVMSRYGICKLAPAIGMTKARGRMNDISATMVINCSNNSGGTV